MFVRVIVDPSKQESYKVEYSGGKFVCELYVSQRLNDSEIDNQVEWLLNNALHALDEGIVKKMYTEDVSISATEELLKITQNSSNNANWRKRSDSDNTSAEKSSLSPPTFIPRSSYQRYTPPPARNRSTSPGANSTNGAKGTHSRSTTPVSIADIRSEGVRLYEYIKSHPHNVPAGIQNEPSDIKGIKRVRNYVKNVLGLDVNTPDGEVDQVIKICRNKVSNEQ